MSETALTQIVPVLRPQSDGISDYALNLALQLREHQGVNTRFIVCDPQWDGPNRIEGFAVRRLRARTDAGIWSLLASAKERSPAVLLHYCGYGYDAHGIPLWLSRGLRSWLAEAACGTSAETRRFATVFHDSWPCSAAPWGKAFYREKLQQWIVKSLHRHSQFSVTGAWRLLAVLNQVAPKKTLWFPTPSSVPVRVRPGEEKLNRDAGFRVVIFGTPHSRYATVQAHANLLQTLDKKKLLASATILGAVDDTALSKRGIELLHKAVSPGRIEILGQLNAEAASHVLVGADLLLSHRTGETACQSGAVMAALGTGCPAVLRDGRYSAPLNENEHFIASDDSKPSVDRFERMTAGMLESIAAAGQQWYWKHADLKVIARRYSEALFDNKLPATTDFAPGEIPSGPVEIRLRTPLMNPSIPVHPSTSESGAGFGRC